MNNKKLLSEYVDNRTLFIKIKRLSDKDLALQKLNLEIFTLRNDNAFFDILNNNSYKIKTEEEQEQKIVKWFEMFNKITKNKRLLKDSYYSGYEMKNLFVLDSSNEIYDIRMDIKLKINVEELSNLIEIIDLDEYYLNKDEVEEFRNLLSYEDGIFNFNAPIIFDFNRSSSDVKNNLSAYFKIYGDIINLNELLIPLNQHNHRTLLSLLEDILNEEVFALNPIHYITFLKLYCTHKNVFTIG